MSSEIIKFSTRDLLDSYRKRQLSPVEVTQAILNHIQYHNDAYKAFCLIGAASALEEARASEQRWMQGRPLGMLDGIPTTIKDLMLTKGWPTLKGSKTINPSLEWREDAPVVARLREENAIILGKTTTPEFGWKGVTDSPLDGITRNPWNWEKTPGGSSGGAAVAAALGLGVLHVGSDGGGSIRMPAGFTGIFGLKPTFGLVPAYPLSPFGTISHIGPMTRSVEDAAIMLNVIAQPDARDWHALPVSGRDFRIGLEDGVRGLRIAFSPNLGYVDVHAEIAEKVREAVMVFDQMGAVIEEVDPGFEDPREIFDYHWYTSAAALLSGIPVEQHVLMDPGLVEVAAQGAAFGHLDYVDATLRRGQLGQRMSLFHQDYDLLLTPTLPIPAFAAGQEVADPDRQKRWTDWTPFSYPFNLTQQPAASVPCGFTKAGLPVGLQIVGGKYQDALVLRAARTYESVKPIQLPQLRDK